ncbi:small integral membrane protein 4 [Frankliniella occidentalis]|uniref:Small integral membrane protein 4 n=1 Tax=Frankliniella occidentalis TaxID=133901 RepID=A0A6J1S4Y6_FRAOC|nr:small integral membrane protein 4 [Frankliniella occidentalis]XP_052126218.1 small integral membrane protein 4 [Frankliniella occidentalis]
MWNFRSKKLARLLRNYPGYKTIGEFAFLPVFFVGGAALEYVMINWHFGEVNFYRTFKRRQAKEQAEAIVHQYLAKKNQVES